MLSVKQGGIKYQFWVCGMTRPGTEPQSLLAIGEHSNYENNEHSFFICYKTVMKEENITLGYKYITRTLYFTKGVVVGVSVRERKAETNGDESRQKQTATLTHDFVFYWPYHAVLSSRPYVFSSPTWRTLSDAACGSRLHASRDSLSVDCSTLVTAARLPVSHMGICVYYFSTPTHFRSAIWLLLLIFTDTSCAEKSLIDGLVKVRYATYILVVISRISEIFLRNIKLWKSCLTVYELVN